MSSPDDSSQFAITDNLTFPEDTDAQSTAPMDEQRLVSDAVDVFPRSLFETSDDTLNARLSDIERKLSIIDFQIKPMELQRLAIAQEREKILLIRAQKRRDEVFRLDDVMKNIMSYLPNTYRFVAVVNKRFYEMYSRTHNGSRQTSYTNAVDTIHTARLWLADAGPKTVCLTAAFHGRLDILNHLHARAHTKDISISEWENAVAKSSQASVLEWARIMGYWANDGGITTCTMAARYGNLKMLQWARANGCDWSGNACEVAAEYGHLEVLQWARENGCTWGKDTCTAAAANGHLQVLQWARANGCGWDSSVCSKAAEHGHWDVLRWARENGCEWDNSVCSWAAYHGNLPILQWAVAGGCDWNDATCSEAASRGNFEILQWARANGCDWDRATCRMAAKYGHLGILQWARDNGCDWNPDICLRLAQWHDHQDVCVWIRSQIDILNG